MTVSAFRAIANLGIGAKAKRKAQYKRFLNFYREIVETVPVDIVDLFGKMKVNVNNGGVIAEWGLLLTATDYMFWKTSFDRGVLFVDGPVSVKQDMFKRLAVKAESERLEPEERKALLSLLEQADKEESE